MARFNSVSTLVVANCFYELHLSNLSSSLYFLSGLVVDRKKSTKIRIHARKILGTSTLMENATVLVQRVTAESGDMKFLDKLAEFLSSQKGTLPHPLWTSRHDAILVHAIAKHGWIDQETRLRKIAEDSTISWGAPFEPNKAAPDSIVKERRQDMDELLSTASRAAALLNRNRELLETMKCFDHEVVKRSYSLTRQAAAKEDEVAAHSPSHSTLSVDQDALIASNPVSSGGNKEIEPVDLPTHSDLKKRAKLLLMHSHLQKPEAAASTGSAPKETPSHGFAVLDQTSRCNVLLAEMLKCLKKSKPLATKQNRKFSSLILEEVSHRVDDLKALAKKLPERADDISKSVSQMEKIGDHVILVQRNLTKSQRLYRNVIRVILGEDVHTGRKDTEEPLFPKPIIDIQAASKAKNKKQTPSQKATGERALEAATRMLYSRNERENGEISSDKGENFLQLTEIETQILSAACSMGIPVWTKSLAKQTAEPGLAEASSRNPYSWSWASFGESVAHSAKEAYRSEKSKLGRFKKEYSQEGSDRPENAEQLLYNTERMCSMKGVAADQAADYAGEPENCAKKTIMMLAKLFQLSQKSGSILSPSDLLGPGSKEMMWLESEVQRWAVSLDIVDHQGQPLGFTAFDFLDDVEGQEHSIEISAIMDRKGTRGVLSQICVVSCLRASFLKSRDSASKSGMLEQLSKSMASAGHHWESHPVWWGPHHGVGRKNMAYHDQLLLERLLHSGFAKVLDDTRSFGLSHVVSSHSRCLTGAFEITLLHN